MCNINIIIIVESQYLRIKIHQIGTQERWPLYKTWLSAICGVHVVSTTLLLSIR